MFNFSPLETVLWTLLTTHITILSVTIYLHRGKAHRAIEFSPILEYFFRIWLWVTTGINTTEWVAIHRKHHAKCETKDDPHSPVQKGLGTVLFKGLWLYRDEARNQDTLTRYGQDCPKDRLEAFFFKNRWFGLFSMLLAQIMIFGLWGVLAWVISVVWIPFWAAGVINGVGHYFGYRNFRSADASRNISPIGFIIGGEELHNNHHAFPTSAKLSYRKGEFDIGWFWIQTLEKLNLLSVKRTLIPTQSATLQTEERSFKWDEIADLILKNRLQAIRCFESSIHPKLQKMMQTLKDHYQYQGNMRSLKSWIFETSPESNPSKRAELFKKLDLIMQDYEPLRQIKQTVQQLQSVWTEKALQLKEAKERLVLWGETFQAALSESSNQFIRDLSKIQEIRSLAYSAR